ncbi:hypothetical protein [Arthrobacter sp. MYb213]|uniref:hypothetical protein n=1 Tax=Arthrobacter sp. MYb213 TaxID=1848595 RepID=UPI000CFD4E03|nr:hypothetical protein [Arthrobacter sp. MYb213]PRB69514.1 hypothetical protein CQ011_12185 [Arthrobacter sp. MYb213]
MAPTIRMRALISGSRDGKKWPKPGQTLKVPAAEANQLIAQGIAELATAAQKATDETVTETATVPAGNVSLAAARQAKAEAEDAKKQADAEEVEAKAKAEVEEAEAKARAEVAKAKPAPKGKAD